MTTSPNELPKKRRQPEEGKVFKFTPSFKSILDKTQKDQPKEEVLLNIIYQKKNRPVIRIIRKHLYSIPRTPKIHHVCPNL